MDRHVSAWLQSAMADAERRGLPELKPLLEGLAQSLTALRDGARGARGAARKTDNQRP